MEDHSFIKYTRSLHNNPLFKSMSFEYRHIFMTILVNMAFKPVQMNDHGHLIDLNPGQFMTTVRGLAKLCDEKGIDGPKVQRALKMFENIGFSTQETIHRKTIITIRESSICECIKIQNDTRIDTKSIQDRYKIDTQKKNDKKDKKEKTTTTPTPSKGSAVVAFYDCLKENNDLNDDEKEVLQKYDEGRVKLALEYSKHIKPKTTLIQMLRWHCGEIKPPSLPSKVLTDQQKIALSFNTFLLSIGQELMHAQNKTLILEGLVMTPHGQISLSNPVQVLRQDFEEVKRAHRQRKHG